MCWGVDNVRWSMVTVVGSMIGVSIVMVVDWVNEHFVGVVVEVVVDDWVMLVVVDDWMFVMVDNWWDRNMVDVMVDNWVVIIVDIVMS